MRQFTIGMLCTAAILTAAACGKSPESQAPEATNATGETYYTVKADDIAFADAKLDALHGTFQMIAATAGDGIPSVGAGGACFAFPAKNLGFTAMAAKKCSTNQDCYHDPEDPNAKGADAYKSYTYVPASDPTHRENSYGYCETQNKQCWSKPVEGNDAVCNRPLKMTAGTVNPVPKTGPVNVGAWVKQGAKARVVACLNKGSPATWPNGKPPCSENVSADRIEVMGTPATLHK